jgi:hypothetical protein
MFRSRVLGLALIGTLSLVACGQSSSAAEPSVVSAAGRYVPTRTNPVEGTQSGDQSFPEAAHGCVGVSQKTLRTEGWISSFQRIWVDRSAKPPGYIELCLSEFQTTQGALANFREDRGSWAPIQPAAGGAKPAYVRPLALPHIPNAFAYTNAYGGALVGNEAIFVKGRYVVEINGSATMSIAKVPSVAGLGPKQPGIVQLMAERQYLYLPSG